MSLVRRIARPLLAAPYIAAGIDAVRRPESTEEVSPTLARRAAERVPQLERLGPEGAVRAQGALMIGAGALLALGRFPRPAALLLAATVLPATVDRARAARSKDGDPAQRADLLRGLGSLGGLLLAAADTGGRPSLGWRVSHLSSQASSAAGRTSRQLKREIKHARP